MTFHGETNPVTSLEGTRWAETDPETSSAEMGLATSPRETNPAGMTQGTFHQKTDRTETAPEIFCRGMDPERSTDGMVPETSRERVPGTVREITTDETNISEKSRGILDEGTNPVGMVPEAHSEETGHAISRGETNR